MALKYTAFETQLMAQNKTVKSTPLCSFSSFVTTLQPATFMYDQGTDARWEKKGASHPYLVLVQITRSIPFFTKAIHANICFPRTLYMLAVSNYFDQIFFLTQPVQVIHRKQNGNPE